MAPKQQEDSPDAMMAVDQTAVSADTITNNNQNTEENEHQKKIPEIPLVQLDLDNITYAPVTKSAQGESSRTTVLSNITTTVAPYQLTAWMGPSGSGKTSLISVAANLLANPDDLTNGVIRVNGDEGKLPKRLVGVVWQDDLLLSNLTVEETIFFSARLKTPCEVPNVKVRFLVEETMEELGLLHVRNSLIGSSTGASGQRGISGGERKRVAVAAELVVRPSLLLLDEPTSGLDATTAWSLVSTLQQLAHKGGHAIAVVIHQPRTEIFNMFDHLLLLNHGKTVYDGPPKQARAYLESIPSVTPLPAETGLADWLMDIIKADDYDDASSNKSRKSTPDSEHPKSVLAAHWSKRQQDQQSTLSDNTQVVGDDNTYPSSSRLLLDGDTTRGRRMSSLKELHKSPNYVTPFRVQLKLLTQRTLKQMRGEKLTKTTILLTFTYTFFSCLFWWQLPDNTSRIFERNSLFFFMLIAQSNGIVTTSISVFQRERALLSRERAKKLYGVLPFFIAKTCSDMTNNVLLPCVYGAITYWAAGFRPDIQSFAKFMLVFYLTMSSAQSLGLFLSILIPSMAIALVLAPPITLFFMIMGGFYIPFESMHPGIRWASWLSFARYGYSSMLINEYGGRDITCASDEGQDAAISIGETGECPVPGEDVLSSLGIEDISANYWFGIGILVVLQVAFRVASYIALRRTK